MKLLIKGFTLVLAIMFLWVVKNIFDISLGLLILIYTFGMMNVIVFKEVDELSIHLSSRKKSIK